MASQDESAADISNQGFNRQDIDELLDIILNVGNFQTMQEVLDYVLVESVKSPSRSIASIRYYLSRGASTFAFYTTGLTAFELAVIRGDKEIVQLFIEYGDSALSLDLDNYESVIKDDKLEVLELLLSSCNKDELLTKFEDELSAGKYSPLYWAAKFHKFQIIRFLVDAGMDIDGSIDGCQGYNLLHHAALAGDMQLADYLLELGASVYRCTKCSEFQLPFQIAAEKGHMDLAMKLLPKDINAPDPKPKNWMEDTNIDDSGFSMLMYACYAEGDESARMLVKHGGDPNKAVHGILPLQIAIVNRRQRIIDYLYPLTDMSLIEWEKELLEEAVRSCLDIEQVYDEEGTMRGMPLLTYLVGQGADLNQSYTEPFSVSPLMTAAITMNAEHMRILIEHGADPNLESGHYLTYGLCNVLYTLVIRSKKRYKALKVLLQANIDVLRLSSVKYYKVRTSPLPNELAGNYKCTSVVQEALMSKEGELVTLCVEAGCCLYDTKDILDAVKDSIEPPLQPHIIELIEKYDSSPRSLEHLAKFAARRCLGHKDVDSRIDTLRLPKHMKNYLKYVGF